MPPGSSADPVPSDDDEGGGVTKRAGEALSVLATLGIVAGLVVIALMAAGPALVDLNERFPPEEPDESGAAHTGQDRRPLDLRRSHKDPNFGLN